MWQNCTQYAALQGASNQPIVAPVALFRIAAFAQPALAARERIIARAYNAYAERASSAIVFSTLCAVATVSVALLVFLR